MSIDLSRYRAAIDLDQPWPVNREPDWRSSVEPALGAVGEVAPAGINADAGLHLLRGRLAEIDPYVLPAPAMDRIERINAAVTAESGTVDIADIANMAGSPLLASQPEIGAKLKLVVADITLLRVDAIVNAANQQMLGCRIPNHRCIDNAIHSSAGPRLRDDCATIMEAQGQLEPIGVAKVTRGYALPSRFVIHTVGPQLVPGSEPTQQESRALAACYRSCLDVAGAVDSIRSIAMCGISTGVFAFPKPAAASVALTTIVDWLSNHPGELDVVVINCFSQADADHYLRLLGSAPAA